MTVATFAATFRVRVPLRLSSSPGLFARNSCNTRRNAHRGAAPFSIATPPQRRQAAEPDEPCPGLIRRWTATGRRSGHSEGDVGTLRPTVHHELAQSASTHGCWAAGSTVRRGGGVGCPPLSSPPPAARTPAVPLVTATRLLRCAASVNCACCSALAQLQLKRQTDGLASQERQMEASRFDRGSVPAPKTEDCAPFTTASAGVAECRAWSSNSTFRHPFESLVCRLLYGDKVSRSCGIVGSVASVASVASIGIMADAMRALLDELMGEDRNLGAEERQKPK